MQLPGRHAGLIIPVGMVAAAVDHLLVAPAEEPQIVKEMQGTIYHILWELVHVFLAQPGLLGPQEGS